MENSDISSTVEKYGKNTIRITPKDASMMNSQESSAINIVQSASFRRKLFFFDIKWPYDFDPRFLFGQRSPFCKQFCKHSCLFVHIRYFILILLEWMKHRPNYISIISDLLVILNISQYFRHIHTHTWLNNDDHALMVVLRWIFPASLS